MEVMAVHDEHDDSSLQWTAFLRYSSASVNIPRLPLTACVTTLYNEGRPALLSILKTGGLASLEERQRVANAIAKATRQESLLNAATSGDVSALKASLLLLPTGSSAVNALGGPGGMTPLMAAAGNGHDECIMLLLRSSAELDAARSQGLTALMIAAIKGHSGCVARLLSASASPARTDEDGWSPLMYAARHGQTSCVRELLDARADPHHRKANGFGCVHAAACAGDVESIRALLEAGADAAARSARGWSAAEYATAFHCGVQLGVQLGVGAAVGAPDEGGGQPQSGLHAEIHGGQPESGLHEEDAHGTPPGKAPSTALLLRFSSSVPGHTHDESWRERPVKPLAGEAAPSYWCGARYSHDTNVLQVLL